jgi:hypothetical protein
MYNHELNIITGYFNKCRIIFIFFPKKFHLTRYLILFVSHNINFV